MNNYKFIKQNIEESGYNITADILQENWLLRHVIIRQTIQIISKKEYKIESLAELSLRKICPRLLEYKHLEDDLQNIIKLQLTRQLRKLYLTRDFYLILTNLALTLVQDRIQKEQIDIITDKAEKELRVKTYNLTREIARENQWWPKWKYSI